MAISGQSDPWRRGAAAEIKPELDKAAVVVKRVKLWVDATAVAKVLAAARAFEGPPPRLMVTLDRARAARAMAKAETLAAKMEEAKRRVVAASETAYQIGEEIGKILAGIAEVQTMLDEGKIEAALSRVRELQVGLTIITTKMPALGATVETRVGIAEVAARIAVVAAVLDAFPSIA